MQAICARPLARVTIARKTIEGASKPGLIRFGRSSGTSYKTVGYSEFLQIPAKIYLPGVLLRDTGARTGILLHPGHSPNLYLSSIGCFNLTKPLGSADKMDFWESRARVIAIIESLKAFKMRSAAAGRRA